MRTQPWTPWWPWSSAISMSTNRPERVFEGKVASPGLAAGHIRLALRRPVAAVSASDPTEERRRFDAALAAAVESLGRLMERQGDEAAVGMLEFQLALIEDDELVKPVRDAIAGGTAAATAWSEAIGRQIADYEGAEAAYFRARSADLADLRERVIGRLLGAPEEEAEDSDGAILVAEDL